jgi:hypothetical protein
MPGWVSKTKSDKVYTILDVYVFVKKHRENPTAGHLYLSEVNNLKKEFKKIQFVLKDDQADMFKYFTGQIGGSEFLKESLRNQKMKDGGVTAPVKALKGEETKMEIESEGLSLSNRHSASNGQKGMELETAKDKDGANLSHVLEVYSAYLSLPEQKFIESDKNKKEHFFQQLLEVHKRNYGMKMQPQFQKPRQIIPKFIIIVPQKPQFGNLCLKNAKEFLCDGKFIEASSIKGETEGTSKCVEFTKRIHDKEAEFEIWDDYLHLKHNYKEKL